MVTGEMIDGIFLNDTQYTNGNGGGVYILGTDIDSNAYNYIRYPIPDKTNTIDLGIKNYLLNNPDSSDFFIKNKLALTQVEYSSKTYFSFVEVNIENQLNIYDDMSIHNMDNSSTYSSIIPLSVVSKNNHYIIKNITSSGLNHFDSTNLNISSDTYNIYPNESYIYNNTDNYILSRHIGFNGSDTELQILMKNRTKNVNISSNNKNNMYTQTGQSVQSSMWSNEFDRINNSFLPKKRSRLVYLNVSKYINI